MGGLGGVGVGLSKKKVEPQFGVSFGLPYPSGAYPFNTFNGGSPAQNPYFGSISPNGLNLGLVNVNPLVSFQFAKNEFGEKTFKPLVNFHVTPNENLISKVGNLFKAKKHGYGYGGSPAMYNQHYHTHMHYPNYQSPPHYYESPHHYENPHHYEGGPPHFGPSEYFGSSGPSGFSDSEYGFSSPGGYFPGSYSNNIDSPITAPAYDFDVNTNTYYSRSGNGSVIQQNYANNFDNYNNQQNDYAQNVVNTNLKQMQNKSFKSVSFPSNRRKRSVDESTSNDGIETNHETIAPKSKFIEKVIKSMLGT